MTSTLNDPDARLDTISHCEDLMDNFTSLFGDKFRSPDTATRSSLVDLLLEYFEDNLDLVTEYSRILIYLSLECPLDDVKFKVLTFLSDHPDSIRNSISFPQSTSSYVDIADKNLYPRYTATKALLTKLFLKQLFIPHLIQVLGVHPSYLEIFLSTQKVLMEDSGSLPIHIRYYLAILAAAEHSCTYLIIMLERKFLAHSGDERWLQGAAFADKKIKKIAFFNSILARRPFIISTELIRDIVTGENRWTLSEFVSAVVILSSFHSLCSIVFGSGINFDIYLDPGFLPSSPSQQSKSVAKSLEKSQRAIKYAQELARKFQRVTSQESGSQSDDDDFEFSENSEDFNSSSSSDNSILLPDPDSRSNANSTSTPITQITSSSLSESEIVDTVHIFQSTTPVPQATDPTLIPNFVHKYRSMRPPSVSFVSFQQLRKEYNEKKKHLERLQSSLMDLPPEPRNINHTYWKTRGYPLLLTYNKKISEQILSKLDTIKNLTYFSYSDQSNVDTRPIRRFVHSYVQSIFGLTSPGQKQLNQLLQAIVSSPAHVPTTSKNPEDIGKQISIRFKTVIRKITTNPESFTLSEFSDFGIPFQPQEKIHIILICAEARLQATLVHCLRRLSSYLEQL